MTRGAGESLTIVNVPLRRIIPYAYDLGGFQLAGGPGWIGDERCDIVAKTSVEERIAAEIAEIKDETSNQRKHRVARLRERLRSLLADRFGLRLHMEQRERTVLAFRIANDVQQA